MHYHIIRMAKGGAGISNETGKTFFVEGALPGESGEAEILEEKPRFGRCRAISRECTSPDRASCDTCSLGAQCDGCGFRHVRPDRALALKAQAVYAEICKSAHIPDIGYELRALEQHDSSRRRARLHIADGKLGFFARGSHAVLSAAQCPVLAPQLRQSIAWLEQNAKFPRALRADIQLDLDDADRCFAHFKAVEERTPRRHQHRPNAKPKAVEMSSLDSLPTLAQQAIRENRFAGIRLENRDYGEAMIRDIVKPAGLPPVTTWRRIGDFSQATAEANAHIHALVHEFLAETNPRSVADLYSGSGNLSFRAALDVPRVFASEFFCSREAFLRGLDDNRTAFAPNTDVSLELCDLSKGIPKSAHDADVIICDPARDGISEKTAQDICHARARALLYVSCEASCLARDLTRLLDHFSLKKLTFVDMFPQTPHVETVAWLVRK
ncbi:MAG: class I SAM-dependent RNA methyltransferase [Proteobacteria bacterium]|nr:class I SAM-dependent RNA methyltransferase [Pseudomonadota bacterium]